MSGEPGAEVAGEPGVIRRGGNLAFYAGPPARPN
jgi:hypothetical protein